VSKKRRAWVLDTETKGTGAEMIPLEKLEERKRLRGDDERLSVIRKAGPESGEPAPEPEVPRAPRRFKLVNVLSRQVLAEGVGVAEALEVLRGARSVVDVNVYVWEPDEDGWRPLTFGERKTLWDARTKLSADGEGTRDS
jgi:hypothetical protein